MGSDSRPVCHRCAQIKQACDGRIPCARCVRLSLPCRPRNPLGAAAEDPAPSGAQPKARIRRVQTGCLMCKRRKKKCDEVKPRCGDCRRLCLDCAWPSERHARSKTAAAAVTSSSSSLARPPPNNNDNNITASAHAQQQQQQQQQQQPPYELAEAASFGTGPFDDLPMPPHHLTDMTLINIPIRASPTPISPPLLGRTRHDSNESSGRSSLASLFSNPPPAAARAFGYPFDDAAAAAATASPDTDMPLHDMSPDVVSWDVVTTTPPSTWVAGTMTPISHGSPPTSVASTPLSSLSLSLYVPQLLPQLSGPQDRALLNHYSTIVSAILSRRASVNNPYNNYLLPLAQGNELVLHCILALSANHWRKLQPSLGDRGLVHKSRATHSLARLLPHVDRTSADIALVSSLLLCMTELFDGTSDGWKLHLRGAKRLLITLREQRGDLLTGHYKFLMRLARFLDSAATTSTCRPPLIGEEEAEAAALDRMTATPDEEDSAVYGIPKELFHLIDRVNTLAELRSTRVDDRSEALFRRNARDIEDSIDYWASEYGTGSSGGRGGGAASVNPAAAADVLHATRAFEHSIRLRLHQIVEGYELSDPGVGRHVDGILDCVQKIRYGSPLESCLLFPLVMAGGSCWKMEHRVVIQDRLMVMERTCGFGYIYNARDLVERVWSRRDQPDSSGEAVNWAKIRYYEMHGLVVF